MKGNRFPFLSISVLSSYREISRERRLIWASKQKQLAITDSLISQLIETYILKNDLSKQV